jgi:hypothetical protein
MIWGTVEEYGQRQTVCVQRVCRCSLVDMIAKRYFVCFPCRVDAKLGRPAEETLHYEIMSSPWGILEDNMIERTECALRRHYLVANAARGPQAKIANKATEQGEGGFVARILAVPT